MGFEKRGEKWIETKTNEIEHEEADLYENKEILKKWKDLLTRLDTINLRQDEAGMLADVAYKLERGTSIRDQLDIVIQRVNEIPNIPKPEPKDIKVPK